MIYSETTLNPKGLSEVNIIQCKIEGCTEVFKTEEDISSNARFICRNHPRSVQVEAAGRMYDWKKDNEDADVHFQEHQFDPNLSRGHEYIGDDPDAPTGLSDYVRTKMDKE